MKRIRVYEFGGPDVLKLEEAPEPTAGPGQVVVKVAASGVNPVDVLVQGGQYAVKPTLPYTPGWDAAGTIEAVGADVTPFATGDRVYVTRAESGAYAEKIVCPAKNVYPLPSNMTFEQGAALGVPAATAYYGLFVRGNGVGGETLLVHGASGSVGLIAVELAKAAGMTVFGTAGTPDGLALVKQHGADAAFDHTADGYLDKVKAATGGKGVDLILEMAADKNLAKDLGVLAPFGRVVVIGSHGPVEFEPRFAMASTLSILGMTLGRATDAELVRIHAGLAAAMKNGTLRPVIAQTFPLAEAAQAQKAVMAGGTNGKVTLVP